MLKNGQMIQMLSHFPGVRAYFNFHMNPRRQRFICEIENLGTPLSQKADENDDLSEDAVIHDFVKSIKVLQFSNGLHAQFFKTSVMDGFFR